MPKGLKKHIRLQKALIRRQFSDFKEQQQKIDELYKKNKIEK